MRTFAVFALLVAVMLVSIQAQVLIVPQGVPQDVPQVEVETGAEEAPDTLTRVRRHHGFGGGPGFGFGGPGFGGGYGGGFYGGGFGGFGGGYGGYGGGFGHGHGHHHHHHHGGFF